MNLFWSDLRAVFWPSVRASVVPWACCATLWGAAGLLWLETTPRRPPQTASERRSSVAHVDSATTVYGPNADGCFRYVHVVNGCVYDLPDMAGGLRVEDAPEGGVLLRDAHGNLVARMR